MSAKLNTVKQDLTLASSGIKAALNYPLALNLSSEDIKLLNNLLWKINKVQRQIHLDTVDTRALLLRFINKKPCQTIQYKRFS